MQEENKKYKKLALKKKLEEMKNSYFNVYVETLNDETKKLCYCIIDDVNELIDICKKRNKF